MTRIVNRLHMLNMILPKVQLRLCLKRLISYGWEAADCWIHLHRGAFVLRKLRVVCYGRNWDHLALKTGKWRQKRCTRLRVVCLRCSHCEIELMLHGVQNEWLALKTGYMRKPLTLLHLETRQ